MRAESGLLILSLACIANSLPDPQQALFVRSEPSTAGLEYKRITSNTDRVSRQSQVTMDQTVQGILKWLQGRYNKTRISRQDQPSLGYLPANPTTTQRPRPFQTSPTNPPQVSFQPPVQSGYPFPQSSPVPTFNIPTSTGTSYRPQKPSQNYLPSQQTPQPPPSQPAYQSPAPSQPSGPAYQSPAPSQPSGPAYQPTQPSGPAYQPAVSSAPSSEPTFQPSFPSYEPFQPETPTENLQPLSPSEPPSPSGPSYQPSVPSQPPAPGYEPTGQQPSGPSFQPSGPPSYNQPEYVPTTASETPIGPSAPSGPGFIQGDVITDNTIDGGGTHPPHIHEINVQCAKEMMTIEIEFDKVFNGLIYSKGYFNSPECIFVKPNSGEKKYTFTVTLNTCGTQYVDQFGENKKAYLENVLVLQNDKDFQEVWDTTRSVRCYWEGTLKKQLTVALRVGNLSQETVTFNGDTAIAKLDIQLGRGPFAPAANGLVKIGELMTLVVTVENDAGFNVLVRDCVARDSDPSSSNIVPLTDSNGCVLKPKLLGAFQMTRNPADNSVIAYAFFQAFKFPDIMDLMIECNVELCKTECAPCPNPNQKLEPGRRRRSADNSTTGLIDPIPVGRRLRVFMPEDLEETSGPTAAPMIINVGSFAEPGSYCLSSSAFLISTTMLLSILITSCISSAVLWLKLQRQYLLNYHK